MCIKVESDERLRSLINPSVEIGAAELAGPSWAMVEHARQAAGAAAALMSARCDGVTVMAGLLPASAQGLAEALGALRPMAGPAKHGGVELRKSWGNQVCQEVFALKRRFGFLDLSLLQWRDDQALPGAWLALVNLGHEGAGWADCTQLRAIAASLGERCLLQARVQEAARQTQRFQDVARASGDWSWEINANLRYSWVQDALARYLPGAVPAPAVGDGIPSGLVVNWLGEPETPLRDFHSVLRQGEAFVRLVTAEYAQGRLRYVSRSAVPLRHADGRLLGFRGSTRDVTQSMEAKAQVWRRDEALRLAKEKAEASSQAKSLLVSKVSHELRTPLNAIVGLAQLIQMRAGPTGNSAVEQWVAQIAKTGWHMVDVLDMLMELGRAGTVGAALASLPLDLVAVVRDAVQIVECDAQARAIDISFDAPVPVPTLGDRRAICQVVVNLLTNAIKYNREGGWIRLSVSRGPVSRLLIQDSGPGLSAEQLGRLFQPFDRLGAETSSVAGHGIGLLICREFVAAMRGSLEVQSAVGQGTSFTLLLPAPEPRPTGSAPECLPECAAAATEAQLPNGVAPS